MNFTGVFVNAAGLALFGFIGSWLGEKIPQRMGETLLSGLALCVIFASLAAIKLEGNLLLAVISITIGGVVGELVDFDEKINRLGVRLQTKMSSSHSRFGEGFVTTTLLVCTGAMAIVGSMESGMAGNANTLYAKAAIDSIVVLVLSSTMGIGCAFSSLPLLLYQGTIVLLSGLIAPYLSQAVINEVSFVGSILIFGVGLNMLNVTKIKMGNFVLAPFVPLLLQFVNR